VEKICTDSQGTWLVEYKECEYVGQEDCVLLGGQFAECESACRHDPKAEMCTMQCVPVCKLGAAEPEGQADESDLIVLIAPQPEETISSPLAVKGKARGSWFFEGSFPVTLTNWDGLIIAQGVAQAQGEWMTEDFVPFEATLTFETNTTVSNRGSLILKKDNPSGLPENDDALEITVFFK
jgi:hypothetical protein